MGEIVSILTFSHGYTAAVVSLGCTLLGAASGLIGVLALLRRRTLMGDALAHATLPGIVGAFMLATFLKAHGWTVEPKSLLVLLSGAAASGLLGVAGVHWLTRAGRLPQDAAIGVVLSVFFGAGYVLLSIVQTSSVGNQAGLKTFILGQTAAMSVQDVALMAGAAGLAGLLAVLLRKELALVAFDEGFARSQGWPAGVLDLVLMASVVAVVVVGLQAVGLVLVIAMLIIPGASARFLTDRLGATLGLSALLGGLSGYLGAGLSAALPNLPAGGIIVLCAGAVFGVCALAGPRHGLVARWASRRALSTRVETEHMLRAMFEHWESQHSSAGAPSTMPIVSECELARLARAISLSPARARRRLVRAGLVEATAGGWRLTPRGLDQATKAARAHRLWETFLVSRADRDPEHADRSADLVEHALDPELLNEIERTLGLEASARAAKVPESVHPLARAAGNAALTKPAEGPR